MMSSENGRRPYRERPDCSFASSQDRDAPGSVIDPRAVGRRRRSPRTAGPIMSHVAEVTPSSILMPDRPLSSVNEYLDRGGGRALSLARERGPDWVAEEVRASGLRGRGGAGFPTG